MCVIHIKYIKKLQIKIFDLKNRQINDTDKIEQK